MTSVRNHRQPLSGNKQFLIGLVCLLFMQACKAKAPVAERHTPQVEAEKPKPRIKVKTPLVQLIQEEAGVNKPLELELRLPLAQELISDQLLFERLQVLEGFLVGFDSLQRRGLPMTINVVNTAGINPDSLPVSSAPIIVHYDAEVFRIFLAQENRWFESRPPMEMHTARIVRYAKKDNAVIVALTRKTELETRVLASLQEQQTGVRLLEKRLPSKAEIRAKLVKGRKNVVYIPTPDENFAIHCLKQLSDLQTEFQLEVFGLPNWVDFPTIDPELMAQLPVYVTSAANVEFNQPGSQRFQQLFKEKFAGEPQAGAFIAFDHALFIGERWLEHQQWKADSFKEKSTQLAQDFNFFEDDDQLINKAVRILAYREYQFKPIP